MTADGYNDSDQVVNDSGAHRDAAIKLKRRAKESPRNKMIHGAQEFCRQPRRNEGLSVARRNAASLRPVGSSRQREAAERQGAGGERAKTRESQGGKASLSDKQLF